MKQYITFVFWDLEILSPETRPSIMKTLNSISVANSFNLNSTLYRNRKSHFRRISEICPCSNNFNHFNYNYFIHFLFQIQCCYELIGKIYCIPRKFKEIIKNIYSFNHYEQIK